MVRSGEGIGVPLLDRFAGCEGELTLMRLRWDVKRGAKSRVYSSNGTRLPGF
jgi:hypothetical protein